MNHEYKSIKEAYLYGFKDGLFFGIEKGLEISENWNNDCPSNSAPQMIESSLYTEEKTD